MFRQMLDIACKPFDPTVIYVIGQIMTDTVTATGDRLSWNSQDGGTTWFTEVDPIPTIGDYGERQCVMLANGRVLLMDGVEGTMRYSDDLGENWVSPSASGDNSGRHYGIVRLLRQRRSSNQTLEYIHPGSS